MDEQHLRRLHYSKYCSRQYWYSSINVASKTSGTARTAAGRMSLTVRVKHEHNLQVVGQGIQTNLGNVSLTHTFRRHGCKIALDHMYLIRHPLEWCQHKQQHHTLPRTQSLFDAPDGYIAHTEAVQRTILHIARIISD